MLVFTIFFGRLAQVGSDGLPYPLFAFAGLLPWTFFSQGLLKSSESLVGSANLIKKVYFPRLIVPVSAILPGLVDIAVSFVVLFVLTAFYRAPLSAGLVTIPFFLLLSLLASLGLGMWLSALNVQYRDVRYVVPFFVQLGLFVTPVIYPASRVLPRLEAAGLPAWVYGLNPMAGVVEGFRWGLFGGRPFPLALVAASVAVSVCLLLSRRLLLPTDGTELCRPRLTPRAVSRSVPRGSERSTASAGPWSATRRSGMRSCEA